MPPILLILLLLLAPITLVSADNADFVGSERCAQCHQKELDLWRGSHHDLAMAEANAETVLGDFNDVEFNAHGVTSRFYQKDGGYFVRTDGPDGELHDYPVRYTFGWYPLQQYLIEFPRGHVQSLGLAWDSRPQDKGGQRWFHLYPDEELKPGDPLHWTSRDQTWNYQCAECHSTKLKKNYDLATDSYKTSWSEIDVACEACHGPGSRHVVWAEKAERGEVKKADAAKGLVVDLADRDGGVWTLDEKTGKPYRTEPRTRHTQIELCARCHSRRGQLWDDYEFGHSLSDTHRLALLDDHLYFPDGQIKDEVYVYGSFIQSKMYAAGVTCKDCHEPHSLALRAEGNLVCARCHLPTRYDTETHHHHAIGTDGASCVACHMPQRTYMVVDDRADHSMRIPRPDLTLSLGTPNACNGCHSDKTPEWAQAAVTGWYPESPHRGRHFAQALHAAHTGDPKADAALLAVAGDTSQPGIARATALDHLADRPQSTQLFTVKRLLKDNDPLVRAAALRLLRHADITTQVDQGWPLLDDPVRTVRLEAVSLLAPLMRQRLPEKFRAQLAKRIEEYEAAQRVNAERPEAHLSLGVLAVDLGLPNKAETAYRTALRLDPSFAPVYINLADLYRQLDRDPEGERVLSDGIAALPKEPTLYHALGLTQVRQKQLDAALKSLQHAAELAPEQGRYAYVYALALDKAGDKDRAIQVLEELLQREPNHRDAAIALMSIHRERGDLAAARKQLEVIKQRLPEDPQIRAFEQQLSNQSSQ